MDSLAEDALFGDIPVSMFADGPSFFGDMGDDAHSSSVSPCSGLSDDDLTGSSSTEHEDFDLGLGFGMDNLTSSVPICDFAREASSALPVFGALPTTPKKKKSASTSSKSSTPVKLGSGVTKANAKKKPATKTAAAGASKIKKAGGAKAAASLSTAGRSSPLMQPARAAVKPAMARPSVESIVCMVKKSADGPVVPVRCVVSGASFALDSHQLASICA